jgi:p-hydroxybenzoate 3-monooxygenase
MLSHLLATQKVESTVVEIRRRREIQETVRAGILEHGTVNMLVGSGVSDRVPREGHRRDGIVLRFKGESHRIDFKQLAGESVWLYPQTDVFRDLAAPRGRRRRRPLRRQRDHRRRLEGKPMVWFTDADGRDEIQADFLVGADGSRSHCRF